MSRITMLVLGLLALAPAVHAAPVAPVGADPMEVSQSEGMAGISDTPPEVATVAGQSFQQWMADYRAEALARGVAPATLDALLTGLTPSERVIELDLGQPGDSSTGPALFSSYLARRLDDARISAGNAAAARMSTALAATQASSGVPASIVLGIWGMESAYGVVTGDFDVMRSLATLAWDGRRRALFTRELDAAVTIVDRGLANRDTLKGSWAGAMGQPQFLPSSYLAYARDGDNDGRIDIWRSDADTIASIANYLAGHGWRRDLGWGQIVTLPPSLDRANIRDLRLPTTCVRPLERHSRWISAGEWRAIGVKSDKPFPADDTPMTLVEPDGPGQGAYLVTANYRALMAYNCSNFYALSVALLGDAIATPAQ